MGGDNHIEGNEKDQYDDALAAHYCLSLSLEIGKKDTSFVLGSGRRGRSRVSAYGKTGWV